MNKVSIIMAAYNAEKTIAPAVDSVLAQTYEDFELLIVDDGSTDSTMEIAHRYEVQDKRIKVISQPKNQGVAEARLTAARQATADWIAILDSDDIWMPEKLERQFERQRKTGVHFLFTGSEFMDEQGARLQGYLDVPEKIGYRELLKQNKISNSSVLIEKDLYLTHFVRRSDIHEDFASWLSVLKAGIYAYGVDEPLLVYRISSGSKSGNKWRSAKMNWNTYRYVGLNLFSSAYYMMHYVVNGVKKYRNIG